MGAVVEHPLKRTLKFELQKGVVFMSDVFLLKSLNLEETDHFDQSTISELGGY